LRPLKITFVIYSVIQYQEVGKRMKYNLLGNTGVLVSEIGLGTMTFGGGDKWGLLGSLDEEEAGRLVDQALTSFVLRGLVDGSRG
jgi:hypothetical protein